MPDRVSSRNQLGYLVRDKPRTIDRLGRRQTTELVIVCAFYSAVARIIETCGVELEEHLPTDDIDPGEWAGDGS